MPHAQTHQHRSRPQQSFPKPFFHSLPFGFHKAHLRGDTNSLHERVAQTYNSAWTSVKCYRPTIRNACRFVHLVNVLFSPVHALWCALPTEGPAAPPAFAVVARE